MTCDIEVLDISSESQSNNNLAVASNPSLTEKETSKKKGS
jgi:hypothetical protein